MSYSIKAIDIFVRKMPPNRMEFNIGKAVSTKQRRPRAILLIRLKLGFGGSEVVAGGSGDRPSFGWLDKRPGLTPDRKLSGLINLVEQARNIYLKNGQGFGSPFDLWTKCYTEIAALGRAGNHEDLTASYASALFERAVIDAVCRSESASFFDMVKNDSLGIVPETVHPELKGIRFSDEFPQSPRTRIFIRHTIGLSDPIIADDLKPEARVNDGEPETLEEYAKRDGLEYFKIKISGNAKADLERLETIWNKVLVKVDQPSITLDGNEAYTDIKDFAGFVSDFERQIPGMFQHTLFIEQPLTRAITANAAVHDLAKQKPLVIDEADGTNHSFKNAFGLGYSGTSHKNCKGVFKSLLNRALCSHFIKTTGRDAFLTGEDLSNMPILPIHQDFAALGLLDIKHCERNGHHYGYGLSHLTDDEKKRTIENHPDLYIKREDEVFLNIQNGAVTTESLQASGFGGATMPDWGSLTPLADWKW